MRVLIASDIGFPPGILIVSGDEKIAECGRVLKKFPRHIVNARHIVHCVNTHSALVEALKKSLPFVEAGFLRAEITALLAVEGK